MRKLPEIKHWSGKKKPSRNWVGTTALLLSILSIALSAYQFLDARQRDVEAKQSKIIVRQSMPVDGPVVFSKLPGTETEFIARVAFDFDVSNVGLVGDAFSEWFFKEIDPRSASTRYVKEYHDARLQASDGAPLAWPLHIGARESRKLRLIVGLKIDGSEVFKEGYKIPLGIPQTCHEVATAFAKRNQLFLGEYIWHQVTNHNGVRGRETRPSDRLQLGLFSTSGGWILTSFSPQLGCELDHRQPHVLFVD